MSGETGEIPNKQRNQRFLPLILLILVLVIALLVYWLISSFGPPAQTEPYLETFDSASSWTVGEGATATGKVIDGVYELSFDMTGDIFWATAGQTFADGAYEVEATPLEGPLDNGYGMLLRVEEDDNKFYVFKVSSDGYVYIGLCLDNCLEQQALVDRDWFSSEAVKQGLGATNKLRAELNGSEMSFFVNDELVGQATDVALKKGDIGLMAETFTPEAIRIAFDNFRVTPLESN